MLLHSIWRHHENIWRFLPPHISDHFSHLQPFGFPLPLLSGPCIPAPCRVSWGRGVPPGGRAPEGGAGRDGGGGKEGRDVKRKGF